MFVEKGAENIKACAPYEISTEIRNVGSDMKSSAVYEVYYVNHGNPKNPHGELVGEGLIIPLEHNESTMLVHEASENGHYMFKAYQVPDYEGSADLEIWSLNIHVNCNAATKDVNEEEEIVDDIHQEIGEELEEESNESKDEEEQTEDEIEEQEEIDEDLVNEEENSKIKEDESKDDEGEDEESESEEDDLDDSNLENEMTDNNQVKEGE